MQTIVTPLKIVHRSGLHPILGYINRKCAHSQPTSTRPTVNKCEQNNIPLQKRGRFARFFCRAAGVGEAMPLSLTGLAPKADGNQLYRLQLAFEHRPDRKLTAGQNVEVGIVVGDAASAGSFAVPMQSLFQAGDSSCLWVFRPDSTVTRRQVELGGIDPEGRAVILDGLAGDEQIVRAGVHVLQEGEKVRVIEAPGRTNVGGLL